MHISREGLIRVFGGKATPGESEAVSEHVFTCRKCWGVAVKVVTELREREALVPPPQEGARLVLTLIEREETRLLDMLRARGLWAGLKHMGPKEQLAAIKKTKYLQTWGMFETILAEASAVGLGAPEAGVQVAELALALIEFLDEDDFGVELRHDLRAEVFAVMGNCLRIAADWQGAGRALATARAHLEQGTGDPLSEARLLSIEASLAADTGNSDAAFALLDRARGIYSEAEDRPAMAKVAVQQANALREAAPEEACRLAGEALLLISGTDLRLELFARSIMTEALIETGAIKDALRNHWACRDLYAQFPEPRIQLRVRFMEAKLLEALSYLREAERLYEDAAEGFWELELYKDMFMTRLHLFGFHLSRGALEKAAQVCRESIEAMEHSGPIHAQMRDVWTGLLTRLDERRVDAELLRAVRDYMARHWRVPAPRSPFLEVDPH